MTNNKNFTKSRKGQLENPSKVSTSHEFLSNWLTIFFSAFGALTLLAILKSQYYGISWPTAWSFIANDKPWLPAGISAQPIMGSHYFGDFQLPFVLVNYSIPYNYNIFNPFFPGGLLIFGLLGFFSLKAATTIFLLMTLIFYFSGVSQLLKTFTSANDLARIAAVGFSISLPLFVGIDRGAAATGVLGLICHVIALSYRKKLSTAQKVLIVMILVFCASTKVYLLTLIIALLWTRLRWSVKPTLIAFLLTNFLLTFFFGGFSRVFKSLIISLQYQSGKPDVAWLYSGVSFSALITRTSLMLQGLTNSLKFLQVYVHFAFVVGLLWVVFVLFMVRKFRHMPDIQWIFLLSLFQYATPVSMMYTPLWASVASILLFRFCSNLGNEELQKHKFSLIMLAVGFSVHILPIPSIRFYQVLIPGVWLLSILLATPGLMRLGNDKTLLGLNAI